MGGGQMLAFNGATSGGHVANHEFGHALGLGHSSTLYCSGKLGTTTLTRNECKKTEYGFQFDLMGKGMKHTSPAMKNQLGYITGRFYGHVEAKQSYVLRPIEVATGKVAVRVVRNGVTLWVHYRQPIGDDVGEVSNMWYSGALIEYLDPFWNCSRPTDACSTRT